MCFWYLISVIGGGDIKEVMLCVLISQDIENLLEKRMLVRPEYIKRLEVLKDQMRLILEGTSSYY